MKFEIEMDEKTFKSIQKDLIECDMPADRTDEEFITEIFQFEGVQCKDCDYRDKVTVSKKI